MIDLELNEKTLYMMNIEKVESNDEYKLYDIKNKKIVTILNIPDVLEYEGNEIRFTSISSNLFDGINFLKEITLPEGVEKIEDESFGSCRDLEKITFGKNIKSVGRFAFVNCFNLKIINFNENLEELGDSAFSGCWNLKEVILPKNLKYIHHLVFNECNKLEKVILPEKLISIGKFAFAHTSITNITIPFNVVNIAPEFISNKNGDMIKMSVSNKIYNELNGKLNNSIILKEYGIEKLIDDSKSFKQINETYKGFEK